MLQVIQQWLKCTPSFTLCVTRYVYELAKSGTAMLMERNGFFEYDNMGSYN